MNESYNVPLDCEALAFLKVQASDEEKSLFVSQVQLLVELLSPAEQALLPMPLMRGETVYF